MARAKNGQIRKLARPQRRAATAIKTTVNETIRYPIQGVGAVTKAAFPGQKKNGNGNGNGNGARRPKIGGLQRRRYLRNCFNALSPCHLALSRPVGPYTVCKTTQMFTNQSAEAVIFGRMRSSSESTSSFWGDPWTSVCGVRCHQSPGGGAVPIAGPGGAVFFQDLSVRDGGYSYADLVPSAFTVQILNPNALQTTSGIVFIGRAHTNLNMNGDLATWDTRLGELVSYNAPRMCSAAKLGLRGVQVSAVPLDMAALASFTRRDFPVSTATEAGFNWDGVDVDSRIHFDGFGPIFIYNPNGVALDYLVTTEWRVRFSPQNPAQAGHSLHQCSPESDWQTAINDAYAMGNGAEDIVEKTAELGELGLGAASIGALLAA